MRIALLLPCFVDALLPEVAIAAVRVLERLGHTVGLPRGQTCCGQPAYNAGHHREARAVARHLLDVFDREPAEAVVCPSGSCAAMARSFLPGLLPEDPRAAALAGRTFEFTEFLAGRLGVEDVGARFEGRVAWHDGCHALRELGVREEPRRLLRAVRGLELVEARNGEVCCGFGGTFSVRFPWISGAMAEAKAAAIEASGADFVAGADPTCLLQIGGLLARRGSPVRTVHIAEILASR